jgi:hypothetical protein
MGAVVANHYQTQVRSMMQSQSSNVIMTQHSRHLNKQDVTIIYNTVSIDTSVHQWVFTKNLTRNSIISL